MSNEEQEDKKPAKANKAAPKRFIPGKVFGTSKELETGGAWVTVGEGCRIMIRRTNYGPAAEYMRKAMRPHAKAVEIGTLPESEAERIIIYTLCNFLVVKWEGIYEEALNTESGEVVVSEVSFTKEAAKKIFKENPEFRKLVWGYAESAETFRQEQDEDDKKN